MYWPEKQPVCPRSSILAAARDVSQEKRVSPSKRIWRLAAGGEERRLFSRAKNNSCQDSKNIFGLRRRNNYFANFGNSRWNDINTLNSSFCRCVFNRNITTASFQITWRPPSVQSLTVTCVTSVADFLDFLYTLTTQWSRVKTNQFCKHIIFNLELIFHKQ